VGQARRLKVPVVIGRGANPAILRRLSLDRARAVAAVTPDDLANVEAAMAARSINEDLQVVIRGGDGEVADETRSLLRIGHVIDVHRVGAAFIAATTLGRDAEGVAASDGYSRLLLPGGKEERFPPEQPV
jgi:voltage-gated potassium channel Kch